jgi:hypothetical protein
MEIKELQEAWKQLSVDSSAKQMLDEGQIRVMLGKRTRSLMDRIDTNIRIGFAIILLFIVAILIYDFRNNSAFMDNAGQNAGIPGWLIVLDSIVDLLIVSVFVTFIIHYYKTRRQCRNTCDIRHTLMKIIGVLSLYQRLFSMALGIILLASATGFVFGFYTSIHNNHTAEGFLFPVLIFGLLFLIMLTYLVFLLFRWMFRRIYGNYLAQLKETLKELDELT